MKRRIEEDVGCCIESSESIDEAVGPAWPAAGRVRVGLVMD